MATSAKDVLLNKGALKLLRRISEKEISDKGKLWNTPECRELVYYSLIKAQSGVSNVRILQVTDKGRQVLLWYDSRRKDRAHDWKIAIFSAISGALLSQPLWALLHAFADWFSGNLL